jgi:hypothetical protein
MKPGQTFPNELELAVLLAMFDPATDEPWHPEKLHVLSRKFTGVGTYTEFSCNVDPDAKPSHRGIQKAISVPGVRNGLDAVLFLKDGRPDTLELVTFGTELWDGTYDGFCIGSRG